MRWIALLLFFFGLFSFNPELKAQTQLGGDIDGELGFDHLGSSVSISADGTRIAAGAPDNNMSTGYTKIYEWNGTNWVQLGGNIIGEAAFNWSGSSVALNANGSRVAIGANGDDENGNNSGHVRIYEWNGSTWVQLGSDIDGEAAEDESGRSVSISSTGDRVAIGAYGNSDNGSFSGHVRIYEWNGTTWIQMGSDIDGETAIDLSGLSVAL